MADSVLGNSNVEEKDQSKINSKFVLYQELIEFTCRFMARGFKKFELKRKLEEELKFEMSIKTYEVLRNKAREMLKDTMLTPEEHRINALEIIYQTLQDDHVHASAKLRAAEMLFSAASSVPNEDAESRAKEIKKMLESIDETIEEENNDIANITMDKT